MKCGEFESLLADYLGGELAAGDRRRLDAHAAECEPCGAELKSLTATLTALGTLTAITAEQAARCSSKLEIRRRPPAVRAVLFAGLRYAAILLAGVAVGWRTSTPSPRPASTSHGGVELPIVPSGAPEAIHPDWLRYAAIQAPLQEGWPAFARQLAVLSKADAGQ